MGFASTLPASPVNQTGHWEGVKRTQSAGWRLAGRHQEWRRCPAASTRLPSRAPRHYRDLQAPQKCSCDKRAPPASVASGILPHTGACACSRHACRAQTERAAAAARRDVEGVACRRCRHRRRRRRRPVRAGGGPAGDAVEGTGEPSARDPRPVCLRLPGPAAGRWVAGAVKLRGHPTRGWRRSAGRVTINPAAQPAHPCTAILLIW